MAIDGSINVHGSIFVQTVEVLDFQFPIFFFFFFCIFFFSKELEMEMPSVEIKISVHSSRHIYMIKTTNYNRSP